jgi:acyl-CoA dehydrogenase
MLPDRPVFDDEHHRYRRSVRRFVEQEISPHFDRWEREGITDRDLWKQAGAAGLLCADLPEDMGGTGDYRYNAVVDEELSYAGFGGPAGNLLAHSDVCSGYIAEYGRPEVRGTWLPRMLSGDAVCAIAMTEPGAGSDLRGLRTRAVREGDEYVLTGSKTFISNGQHCDIAVVAARTDPEGGSRALSLLLVPADSPGFRRGRNLEKLGLHSADTSELTFDRVRVPAANLLGAEGGALAAMMTSLPKERMSLAISAVAAAQKAYDLTRDYVRTRTAFGQAIGDMQNTRFVLADLRTDLAVGWTFVDDCMRSLLAGELTADRAAMAKLWITEMQGRVMDRCLQFFGGYGYMREYEISRLFADARVQRIYGGASEVMRELISRNL